MTRILPPRRLALLLLAIAAGVAGCNRPEAQVPVTEADLAPVDATCTFCADPGFVRICDVAAGVRTTLHWNLAETGADRVAIFVVDDQGVDQPIAEQPAQGQLQTGPYLRPGSTFKAKDLSGNVLATVVIAGRGC